MPKESSDTPRSQIEELRKQTNRLRAETRRLDKSEQLWELLKSIEKQKSKP